MIFFVFFLREIVNCSPTFSRWLDGGNEEGGGGGQIRPDRDGMRVVSESKKKIPKICSVILGLIFPCCVYA